MKSSHPFIHRGRFRTPLVTYGRSWTQPLLASRVPPLLSPCIGEVKYVLPMNSVHSKATGPAQEESLRLPELLAPAGDWECARAAVENGADAIYFGLDKFNARMRAQNFTRDDLPKLMEFLHRRGVKGYVTFNTLVFENEMAAAEEYLRSYIIAAGVDALPLFRTSAFVGSSANFRPIFQFIFPPK